jgi:hypothetical protein
MQNVDPAAVWEALFDRPPLVIATIIDAFEADVIRLVRDMASADAVNDEHRYRRATYALAGVAGHLQRLSKPPLKRVEADEGTGERGEGMVDVEPAFVTDGQAAEAVDPCECALDDPSVLAQPLAALDATARDPVFDPAPEAGAAAAAMIIGLVGVQLVRPAARPARLARDGCYRVEQLLEGPAVVSVGAAQQESERDAAPVHDEVALGACLSAIRRVRPGSGTPLLAAMDALSTQARLQSMRSTWRRRRSNSRCSRSHTPASCQSRSRRQQVTPDPQPISCGSISQGMPERSTKRMPLKAAREGTAGRPPSGLGRSGGNSGSMTDQSSSETRGFAMPFRSVQPNHLSRF